MSSSLIPSRGDVMGHPFNVLYFFLLDQFQGKKIHFVFWY